jgi:hypothetical protein
MNRNVDKPVNFWTVLDSEEGPKVSCKEDKTIWRGKGLVLTEFAKAKSLLNAEHVQNIELSLTSACLFCKPLLKAKPNSC